MGDFFDVGFRLGVHKDCLAALIRNPNNWRPGELAQVLSVKSEGARRVSFSLRFSDGKEHDETISFDPLENRVPSHSLGIYYRFSQPLNGNPAEHAIVARGLNFNRLVQDHYKLRHECPYHTHLCDELLLFQYNLLFPEPLSLEEIRAAAEIATT